MSFADITKPNKAKRLDGYFNNLKAGSLDLDLSCNVPEISLEQLRLTNPLTENKTTLKTRRVYCHKRPEQGQVFKRICFRGFTAAPPDAMEYFSLKESA